MVPRLWPNIGIPHLKLAQHVRHERFHDRRCVGGGPSATASRSDRAMIYAVMARPRGGMGAGTG